MFFADFLFALAIGLLFTVVFAALFRNRGPWGLWWVFLLIVLLGAWAGGVWTTPAAIGPPLFGVYWLPLFVFGLIFALVLAAATPVTPPRTRGEAIAQAQAEEAAVAVFGIFFWVMLVGLIVAVILGYAI